ncbi:hypothetical protein PPYR_00717 [Photinus pyralis]|uniref:Zinc finger PHD-type domain-containing protein n=1 Tax=Photinus pyralis TaxID=7054 RepID=A0A5N4B2C2_PHOPY|nr:hypothetical protein PPYR_00717 [Photinus pyralis]
MKNTPNRKLNRLQFGKLLGESWGKSASVHNAVSAFKSTGVMPFNPQIIPDYAFLIIEDTMNTPDNQNRPTQDIPVIHQQQPITPQPKQHKTRHHPQISPQPGPSGNRTESHETPPKITPGKALDLISPVPTIAPLTQKVKRNLSRVITSPEYIGYRKEVASKKQRKSVVVKSKAISKSRVVTPRDESSSSESENLVLDDTSSGEEELEEYENECAGCHEDYRQTQRKDDWIQCVTCKRWLHEGCTSFENVCLPCGKSLSKKKT